MKNMICQFFISCILFLSACGDRETSKDDTDPKANGEFAKVNNLNNSAFVVHDETAHDSILMIEGKYKLPVRVVKFENISQDTLFFNKSPMGWLQFPSCRYLYKDSLVGQDYGDYVDFVEDTIPPNFSKDMFIMKEEKSIGVKFGFYYRSSKDKVNSRTFDGEMHW